VRVLAGPLCQAVVRRPPLTTDYLEGGEGIVHDDVERCHLRGADELVQVAFHDAATGWVPMQALSLRTVFETSVIKMNTACECRSVRPEQLVAGLAPILAPAKGQKPCLSRPAQPKRQFRMCGYSSVGQRPLPFWLPQGEEVISTRTTSTYKGRSGLVGRTGFEPVTSSVSGNFGVSVAVGLSRKWSP
jgi:hypothetical protein